MNNRTIVKVRALPAGYWQVIYRERGRIYASSFSRAECPNAESAARATMAGIRPGVFFSA